METDPRPYRLLHTPTGYYWQPITGSYSNFTEHGFIHTTDDNILNQTLGDEVEIVTYRTSHIFKENRKTLNWQTKGGDRHTLITKKSEWQKEFTTDKPNKYDKISVAFGKSYNALVNSKHR